MAFSRRVCREKGGTGTVSSSGSISHSTLNAIREPEGFQADVAPGDLQFLTQGDHVLIPPLQNRRIPDQRGHVLDGSFGRRGICPDQEHEGVECVEDEVGVELGPHRLRLGLGPEHRLSRRQARLSSTRWRDSDHIMKPARTA